MNIDAMIAESDAALKALDTPPPPPKRGIAEDIATHLAVGANKYLALPVAGITEMAGKATGIKPLEDAGKAFGDNAESWIAQKEQEDPSQKFRDISGVGDAARWAGEQMLEFAPQAVIGLATGGAGAAAGRVAAGGLARAGITSIEGMAGKKAVQAAVANTGRSLTAKELGILAADRAGTAGAIAATGAGSIAMESSTIYRDQKPEEKDMGRALLYGTAAGILDTAFPAYLMKKTGLTKIMPGMGKVSGEAEALTGKTALTGIQRVKDTAKISGLGIGEETIQEGVQTVLENIGANKQVYSDEVNKAGGNFSAFLKVAVEKGISAAVHPEAWNDIIESMAAGGLIGGAMGGGSSAAGHVSDAMQQRGQQQQMPTEVANASGNQGQPDTGTNIDETTVKSSGILKETPSSPSDNIPEGWTADSGRDRGIAAIPPEIKPQGVMERALAVGGIAAQPQPAIVDAGFTDVPQLPAPPSELEKAIQHNNLLWSTPGQSGLMQNTGTSDAQFQSSLIQQYRNSQEKANGTTDTMPALHNQTKVDGVQLPVSEVQKVVPGYGSDLSQSGGQVNGVSSVQKEVVGAQAQMPDVRNQAIKSLPFAGTMSAQEIMAGGNILHREDFLERIGMKPVSNTHDSGRHFFNSTKGSFQNGTFSAPNLSTKEAYNLEQAAGAAGFDVELKQSTQAKSSISGDRVYVPVPNTYDVVVKPKNLTPVTPRTPVTPSAKPTNTRRLDTTSDDLMTAIAHHGGIDLDTASSLWGKMVDDVVADRRKYKDREYSVVHLRPIFSKSGKSIDDIGRSLAEDGYIATDEHGKYDPDDLESKIAAELSGTRIYSTHNSGKIAENAYRDAEIRYSEMINAMTDGEYEEFSRNQWLDDQVQELADADTVLEEFDNSFDAGSMTGADWQKVEKDFKEALDATEFSTNSSTEDTGIVQGDDTGKKSGIPQVSGSDAQSQDSPATGTATGTKSGVDRLGPAMQAPRAAWNSFPDVLIHTGETEVKKHPLYQAAKSGDADAAAQLVEETFSEDQVDALRSLLAGTTPVLVSVHAYEDAGINSIPEAFAEKLSQLLDLEVDGRIVQTNVVGHTGANGFTRMARQALFDGEVTKGTEYVLVDDFVGQGGTFANLKGYIEAQGGKVVAAVALTGKPYSAKLSVEADQLKELRHNHGNLEQWWKSRFGHSFDSLTQSEARYLTRTPDADKIRNSIVAAEQTGNSSETEEGSIDDSPRPDTGETALSTSPEVTAQDPSSSISNPKAKTILTDFGEKLGGARKDRQISLDAELTDAELAGKPLSEIWPKKEVDAIEDIFLAAVATAARAEVPSKPQKGYKLDRWVQQVKTVRMMAKLVQVLTRDAFMEKAAEFKLEGFTAKVRLLEQLERSLWGRIGKVAEYKESYYFDDDGKKVNRPWMTVQIDKKTVQFQGANILDELDKIQEKLGVALPEKQMQFEVRGRGTSYNINKKGDALYRSLKHFTSSKEAWAFANSDHAALVQAWEELKDKDNVKERDLRKDENRPRTGADHREGKDVTPDMILQDLGFRGIEFGNWVGQGKNEKERQGMLNSFYDAVFDLASILGVPPKALSLNGTLGIGFGSRGSGWASAHYEPTNLVINMTKTRGSGSLAHELFHALDRYFQMQRGPQWSLTKEHNYITHYPETYYQDARSGHRLPARRFNELKNKKAVRNPENWTRVEGVRPEVAEAFSDLVTALDASPMAKRSSLIDKGKSGGYWSSIIERGARAFENYIIFKMQQQGYNNDYLANVVDAKEFSRDIGRYPYLLDTELAPVAEAFDNLFATIKTEETEKGIALLSRSAGSVVADHPLARVNADGVIERFLTGSGLSGKVKINLVDSFASLPDNVRTAAEQEGGNKDNTNAILHKGGSVWLIRDAHETETELETSIFHEVYGHLGIFRMFGLKSIQELNRLFNKLGGLEELQKLADKYAVRGRFDAYWSDFQNDKTKGIGQAKITAELIAMIGERSPDLMQKAKAVWGAIKDALRRMGFNQLSQYTDSDIAFLLARGRVELKTGAKAGGFTVLMTAWHGSPHDHNGFSTDKIGSGEGAQAYGYGLYFAGNRAVAEYYRDNLSKGKDIAVHGKTLKHQTDSLANSIRIILKNIKSGMEFDEAKADVINSLMAMKVPSDMKAVGELDKLTAQDISEVYSGKLYQVELAPQEDEYLQWDKQLGEQSEKIQQLLPKIKAAMDDDFIADIEDRLNSDFEEITGKEIYKILKNYASESPLPGQEDTSGDLQQDVSEFLHSIGVRGIKYLDGSSRGKGESNHNYVIFSDSDIEIKAKFKLDSTPLIGVQATEAQTWVSTLPIAKRVNVVQSISDLPENAQAEITKAQINPDHVQAMELHGTIHVITDNVPDMQRVKALVIGHELAHAGQTKKIVDMAVDWFKRTVNGKTEAAKEAHIMLQRVADRYGFDLTDEKQYRRAVQEATAAIAEQAVNADWKPAGLMQRLFMYVKHWLRQQGLISHVSDSELSLAVAEMLRIGEKRLSVGKGGDEAQMAVSLSLIEMPSVATPTSMNGGDPSSTARKTDGIGRTLTVRQMIAAVNAKDSSNGVELSFSEANFSLSDQAISQHAAKIIDAIPGVVDYAKDNWVSLVNPLDFSRTARWFDNWTPDVIKAGFGYFFNNPFFEGLRDAAKKVFVEEGADRELNRMSLQLQFFGFTPGTGDARSRFTQLKDFVTKWHSGVESTDWEKLNMRYLKLSKEQQAAMDMVTHQGDVKNTYYSSYRTAMLNSKNRAAKLTEEAFALYKDVYTHMQMVSKIREQQIERMMLESGRSKAEVDKKIADYRKETREVAGWMTRNHGEGDYVTAVHHVVKDLKFSVKNIKGEGQQAFLPYYPGTKVMKEIELLAKKLKATVTTTGPGAVVITSAEGQKLDGFLKDAAGIIPAIKDKLVNEPIRLQGIRDKLALKGSTPAILAKIDKRIAAAKAAAVDPRILVMRYSKRHMAKGTAAGQADQVKADLKKYMPEGFRPGEDYITSVSQADTLNEEIFQNMPNDIAMQAGLEKTFEAALKHGEISADEMDALKNRLIQDTAEVLLGRAAGKYQIRRAPYLIEGYETTNVMSGYQDYITGMAGMLSKAEYGSKQFKHLTEAGVPVKAWAYKYVFDSLRNQGQADRISGNARAFVSLWYMGLKPASAIINATQIYTLGVAEIGRIIGAGESATVRIMKAQRDSLKGELTPDEKEIFNSAIMYQQEAATVLSQITGHNEGGTGKASRMLHNVTSKAMALFQNVEVLNRKTIILAAYRVLRDTKLPEGLIDHAALKQALEINNSVNFDTGRHNLPGWARKPLGQTLYALQSFTWNNLNWIYTRATSGERRDMVALLRYTGMLMLIGGAGALAGGDELDKIYRKLRGKSLLMEAKQWTHKHGKEYGTLGEMADAFAWHGMAGLAGLNISNSMRLQIPVASQMLGDATMPEAIGGVWAGLAKKAWMSGEALSKGNIYRAVESAAPEAIAGGMRAYRQYDKGMTTMKGRPVFDENGQPLKYSAMDAVLRTAGFQPAEQSRRMEMVMGSKSTVEWWKSEKDDLLAELRITKPGERKEVMLKIMRFNRDVRSSQAWGKVEVISAPTIRTALTFKANKKDVAYQKKQLE